MLLPAVNWTLGWAQDTQCGTKLHSPISHETWSQWARGMLKKYIRHVVTDYAIITRKQRCNGEGGQDDEGANQAGLWREY